MGLGLSVVRGHKRTRPMTSTSTHGRVQGEGLHCGTMEAGTQAEI